NHPTLNTTQRSILVARAANDLSEESTEFELTPAIYYGDREVLVGEPFAITCIISITEQIHWLKNGEPITRHNLRHGRDDHAYVLAESAIEGEKHKIEAHLSVRHALKVHEGRYQCNHRRGSYHMLYVRETKGSGIPTESGYQTIDELTPNSADDFFTRTWLEQQQPQAPQMPHQSHKQHKSHLAYTNASVSSAMPWHPSAGGGGGGSGNNNNNGMIHRVYSATPPDFPPPRLNLLEHTVAPPEPPTILYNQTRQRPTATASDSTTTAIARATEASLLLTTAHHHAHHQQQQLQQQSQHTLNAFQLPLPPRPNPNLGQSEKYQTYAPHFVPPAVGGGPPSGSGEQTTISAATSTRPMMGGVGPGAGGSAGAAGGGSVMMGAVNHMMMGGGQLLEPSQTLLPIKQGEPLIHRHENQTHEDTLTPTHRDTHPDTHSHTQLQSLINVLLVTCPLCCCLLFGFISLAPLETDNVVIVIVKKKTIKIAKKKENKSALFPFSIVCHKFYRFLN
ncbi:mastermind-like protein 3, partial [Drosophila bipectinata]|uniref:mastermind-like protein 3 n=1 Tax=Drosophila bipectinata TaxID=42026 RepID=UPI0038B24A13